LKDFSTLRFVNLEIGYHLKLGYFLGSRVLLTPIFLSSYQSGGKVSFELIWQDYPLLVKAGKVGMLGFGLKLGIMGFLKKIGNLEYGLVVAYNRYYFDIYEIKNQYNNTTLDYFEINQKKFHETFYYGHEIFYEISSWLYVGIRAMRAIKSESLFKYEININPETKANFTFPVDFNGLLSIEIKFYL
jgi:hypothetical protein